MKRTTQFFVLAVLMGISAGASAQTTVRFPAASAPATLQKTTIGQIAPPTPLAPAQPATAPCPTSYDREFIANELRTQWAQQYQQMLKARVTAYAACVSECVARAGGGSLPSDDPEDPKDLSLTLVLGFCQETCS